ncbi:hypothetical protein K490DRAFT_35481 [Saccharata proteae CBS 121410]|uniref:Peroxisomal membrane protein PEX14 n=1 Tax=Saccharata proteae CBS 121410 TaxID=1314787 RepID=A0A9P4HYD1_9PEZI|nr:hypothetical protein K490DRAFT_35481 [Saccharata proteae CBS 121410]
MDGSADKKNKSIPSWQHAQQSPDFSSDNAVDSHDAAQPPKNSPNTPVEPAPGAEESIKTTDLPESSPLKEQAAQFLQDPSVRDAPTERKRAFLKTKGVNDDVIDELVVETKAEDASVDVAVDAAEAWPKPRSSPPSQSTVSSRDIPPIVTYPEFLTQPTSPPPLITASRILSTIYAVSGLTALTYGLSNYVVQPMTESLNAARHEFFVNAQNHIDNLRVQLEDRVSTVPPPRAGKDTKATLDKADIDDDTSETSDPTELYHRDFGTQTSPNISRCPSAAATAAPTSPTSVVESQTSRLSSLVNHLAMLNNLSKSNVTHNDFVNTQVMELKGYLNEMAYSSPYWGSDAYSTRYGGTRRDKKVDDSIEAVKAEIRSVKGVLLSARNFPSSQRLGR